ncbi:MAG: hypothetical protein JKY55_13655 [Aliivibrio sp.]|uniref:hypothetical protein n=1 Tax=Aliivibrio sp. TaxID=1872443 RepID=UPI001A4B40FF|nr:hypothetical protein [Aliivibrio sp.]
MKVKNITENTSENWLTHWQEFSEAKLGMCVERSCISLATVGTHVQKSESNDEEWYVVPLCSAHSQKAGEEIKLFGNPLVPAKMSVICEA